MNIVDLIRLVWNNLNRMRGRVVLTALGVVIGTASVVVLVSLAAGVEASVSSTFENFGSLNQITVRGNAFMRFGDSSEVDRDELLTPSKLTEIEEIEHVLAVTPVESLMGSSTLTLGRLTCGASVTGIDPDVLEDMGLTVAQGTDALGGGTVLAGANVGDECYDPERPNETPDEDALELYGRTLFLEQSRRVEDSDGESSTVRRTVRMKIGGVLEEVGSSSDTTIYLSLDDAEDLSSWAQDETIDRNTDGYNQLLVIVDDPDYVADVQAVIEDMGFTAMSATSALESVNEVFSIIEAMFGGIGAIAVIVAALGIANTMIMTVLERTREIGLMKAIGATNGDVMSVFLAEAAAIGLLGGIGGVTVGVVLAKIVGAFASSYVSTSGSSTVTNLAVIPPWLLGFSILFAVAIGLGSGIYPAMRAVQLNPVAALKHE